MWMKFTQAGTYSLGADTNNNPSGVFAMNGTLYVGTNGASGTGLYAMDFVNDRMFNFDTTDRTQGDKNIANRNTTVTYATDARTAMAIRNNIVNDVHGNVIYGGSSIETNGGPLNGATFIAAATDDAISVINTTAQMTLDYGDNLTDQFTSVFVTRRGRLYGLNATLAQVERYGTQANGTVGIDVAKADQTTPSDLWDEATGNLPNLSKTAPTFSASPDAIEVVERASAADDAADLIYVGTNQGLTEIHDVNVPSGTSIGWSKFYDTSRSTSLMSGTPRGMFAFNETTGDLADATIRNSVLEPDVAPTYGVNGVRGTGLRFNGTSQYLCSDQNNDGTCDTDTDFNVGLLSSHVEVWFKHSATVTGTDVLIDRRYTAPAGAEGIGYTIEMSSTGQMVYGIQDTAATAAYDFSVTSTQAYNDNQWHHLVAVNTDAALCLYVDGKLAVACSASITALTTLDASQILFVGADGSGAAGGNFWDGDIDDLYFAGNGATASDTLTQAQVRRKYIEGRAAVAKKTIVVTAATSATSTTIVDTGESWTPNEFVGQIVEITGGTGVGQTRRVIANTDTTLTIGNAWSVTPDTTSNFEINPEVLYGSSNNVVAIGATDAFLGEGRRTFVGTNDGADGGGITALEGNNIAYKAYHSDSTLQDDAGNVWTDTDADDIKAIDAKGNVTAFGSLQSLWVEQSAMSFQETIDKVANNINSIRAELVVDGLLGTSQEVGHLSGGADIAEYYQSNELLEAGQVVSIDASQSAYVKQSTKTYDKAVLGVIASQPALVLGERNENSYPVALVGRVPVRVTTDNGAIKAGDYLTSSTLSGVAMKATRAGVVIGKALEDYSGEGIGSVLLFVSPSFFPGEDLYELTPKLYDLQQGSDEKATYNRHLLSYLGEHATLASGSAAFSEIVTDRLVAGLEMIAPHVTTDMLLVNTITSVNSSDIGILLGDKGTLSVKNASGEAGITFAGNGNASFAGDVYANGLNVAGTITADKLVVNEIMITADAWQQAFADGGLESIESRIMKQESRIVSLESLFASASAIPTIASSSSSVIPDPVSSTWQALIGDPVNKEFFVQLDSRLRGNDNGGRENDEKNELAVIDMDSDGLATVSGKLIVDRLQVTGSAIIEGMLHVVEFITARNLIVDELATFLGRVVFSGDVLFEGRPTFNSDTAGIALVKKGTDRVEVRFEKQYASAPMVNVNLTLDEISPMPSEELESLIKRQKALEEGLFKANVRYIVTKRTAKGFVILLDKNAEEDVTFSWIVVAVDNPVVHKGNGDNYQAAAGQNDKNTRPISSSIPTIIPTSSIEKREIEILPSPKEILDGEEVSDHDGN